MRIHYSNEILKPAEVVFPWIAEPVKAMEWQKNVKGGEIITKSPEVIGTTFREEIEEDGKKLEMEGVITNFIENKKIDFHLESKIHIVDISYSIEGYDKKSIMLIDAKIKWKFPMNIMSFLFGNRIKKRIINQLESEFLELKNICER